MPDSKANKKPMTDRTNGAEHGSASHHKTRAEERIEALDTSSASPDTSSASLSEEIEELRARAERAEEEAAENRAAWQRSAADFANYRRRTDQQREEEQALANEMLLLKLLTVADDFDRAIAHVPDDQSKSPWVEGVVAIDRKVHALLESEGVTASDSAEGQPFDPREHDAITYEESDDMPEGNVLRVLQRGYRIRDRVLRPSLVSVAKGGSGSKSGSSHHEHSHSKSHNAGGSPESRE